MTVKVDRNQQIQDLLQLLPDGQSQSIFLQIIQSFQRDLSESDALIEVLQEKVAHFVRLQYAKKAEKVNYNPDQMTIFELMNEANPFPSVLEAAQPASHENDDEVTVTHKPKRKGRKKEIIHSVPCEAIIDASQGQCQCDICHAQMKRIGVATERVEIIVKPARVTSVRHIQSSFKCVECSKAAGKDVIEKGPMKNFPIYNSLCSASLGAYLINQRFNYYMPFYRCERMFAEMGLGIRRNVLANWIIKLEEYYFSPIFQAMKKDLLERNVLHGDETPYQVNKSKANTHRVWVLQTPKGDKRPIAIMECHDSRRKNVFEEIIGTFEGFMHCDAYQVYYSSEGVTPIACWAHLRRKFFEVNSIKGVASHVAEKALAYIDQLFKLERTYSDSNLDYDQRHKARQEQSIPVYKEFKRWADETSLKVSEKAKIGKAFNYFYNHEKAFARVFEDGRFELSNNLAERSIRNVVMGRKNWLFSDSIKGGKANATYHSIILTAKLNNLDIYSYIEYLLDTMPNDPEYLVGNNIEKYLPWHPEIQRRFRLPDEDSEKTKEKSK